MQILVQNLVQVQIFYSVLNFISNTIFILDVNFSVIWSSGRIRISRHLLELMLGSVCGVGVDVGECV